MEIRIAYHPTSETLVHQISQFLKDNGISSNVATVNGSNDVRITVEKPDAASVKMASTTLESSFVHVEPQPGY